MRQPSARTIVYEMHVRGFTRHPSSGLSEKTRGTFAGVIEKIPYLQRLGITAVMRRTQLGNNNAYCQDNETSWLDWSLLDKHADIHRFVTLLNARRLLRDTEHERQRVTLNELIQGANRAWHGIKLHEPDWRDCSHTLALTAQVRRERLLVQLILNAYREPLDFELPPLGSGAAWRRWIDTSLDSPDDIVRWPIAPSIPDRAYRTAAHSAVVLFAMTDPYMALAMAAGDRSDHLWVDRDHARRDAR